MAGNSRVVLVEKILRLASKSRAWPKRPSKAKDLPKGPKSCFAAARHVASSFDLFHVARRQAQLPATVTLLNSLRRLSGFAHSMAPRCFHRTTTPRNFPFSF